MLRMQVWLWVATVAVVFAGCKAGGGKALSQGKYPPAMILNVTSGPGTDGHAVTMAMQLAGHALDDGRNVTLFFNVKSPPLVTRNGPAMQFGGNPPVRDMVRGLMDRGADVLVCPHCLKAASLGAGDLIPGAQVADREKLFGRIGRNSVVFTY
ncbi:MAG: hypothetical protein CMJ49_13290 [Planctomycetaceae bacterium]|nr:hypothetical protein [Planctomycetaceae bacterium]